MTRVKLLKLSLKNFKGIRDFTLKLDGESARVYGENGTGKTSLFDGFTFLLFGKDSQDRTDFEIKTLDKNGNVLQHGLDHTVEGVFDVDGTELTLKRVYSEKWTKQRGSRKESFTGHTTDYFIDGVPVKKKEYDEKVTEIISEDVFKLLTNPRYFNEMYSWKERRELLFEIAGDLTDTEVAKGDKDLEGFISRLEGREIDDYIKIVKSKQREINKELDRIPVRIDELQIFMPDVTGLDKQEVQKQIERIDNQIEELKEKIRSIKNGGETSHKKIELTNIELELAEIKKEYRQKGMDRKYSLKANIQEKESEIGLLQAKINMNNSRIRENSSRLEELSADLNELRAEYVDVNKEVFKHEEDCICPTCGQDLPKEQIEEAREKAERAFNQEKAERLKLIVKKGKAKAESEQSIKNMIKDLNDQNAEYMAKIEVQQKELDDLKGELEKLSDLDMEKDPLYQQKIQEKEAVKQDIALMKRDTQDSVIEVQKDITRLEEEKKRHQEGLNKLNIVDQYHERINTLENKEKALSSEYEALERELYLAETFIKTKANVLEENINKCFNLAKFKLFEEQINGGLKETCITTYNGVPYGKGLNNSMEINIGIDIVNTLQKHYGIHLPMFIDNAEAVTELIDTDTQIISLVVSDVYKELHIERGV